MSPEDVQSEIKLIFARACAESLKETVGSILAIKDDSEKVRAAEAHGAAFASAFIVVHATSYAKRHRNRLSWLVQTSRVVLTKLGLNRPQRVLVNSNAFACKRDQPWREVSACD